MLTLSPQAKAIAAFALGFLLIIGSLNRIVIVVIAIIGESYPNGRTGGLLTGVMLLAVAGAVMLLALNATAAHPEGAWSHLAQAACVLAFIGVGLAALLLLSGVAHDGNYFPPAQVRMF